jgi:DNA-binding NarL/FixJ family response regulator
MKVAIVDDEPLYRKVLSKKLSMLGFTNIIFEAENGADLIRKLKKQLPHIIFIDMIMPEINGMNAAQIILKDYPYLILICISHYKMESYISQIKSIGLLGYLLKDCEEDQLNLAIESALKGKFYLDYRITDLSPQTNKPEIDCSEREIKIMELLLNGMDIEDIADKLNKSSSVIYKSKSALLKRFDIKSDVELVRWALQKGIISANSSTQ